MSGKVTIFAPVNQQKNTIMKKNEIISEIIKRLDNGNGTYSAVDITKIIPVEKRVNARFGFVIAKTLSVEHELGGSEILRLYATNMVSWRCPDLTKKEYETILAFISAKDRINASPVITDETVNHLYNTRLSK